MFSHLLFLFVCSQVVAYIFSFVSLPISRSCSFLICSCHFCCCSCIFSFVAFIFWCIQVFMLFVHEENDNDKANKLIPQPTTTIQFPRILQLLRKNYSSCKPGTLEDLHVAPNMALEVSAMFQTLRKPRKNKLASEKIKSQSQTGKDIYCLPSTMCFSAVVRFGGLSSQSILSNGFFLVIFLGWHW